MTDIMPLNVFRQRMDFLAQFLFAALPKNPLPGPIGLLNGRHGMEFTDSYQLGSLGNIL